MAGKFLALLALTVLALAGACSAVARADQRDRRLDDLFAHLQAAPGQREGLAIEQRIWAIWSEAGDPQVDRLLREGVVAMAQARYRRALERFDRVVEQAPDFAEGWNKRATLHYLMGDFRASVLDIQRTLALESRHFGALAGLGLIYDAVDRPAAALRSFEAALALNPHLASIGNRILELRRQLAGRPT